MVEVFHISTSVTINGNVKIGNNVFIGGGTTIKDATIISNNRSIKMCSKFKDSGCVF